MDNAFHEEQIIKLVIYMVYTRAYTRSKFCEIVYVYCACMCLHVSVRTKTLKIEPSARYHHANAHRRLCYAGNWLQLHKHACQQSIIWQLTAAAGDMAVCEFCTPCLPRVTKLVVLVIVPRAVAYIASLMSLSSRCSNSTRT